MNTLRTVVVAAGLVLAAACSPHSQPAPAPNAQPQADQQPLEPPAQWTCEDGREMTVAFFGDRVDITFADGRKLSLPAVIAASGEAYEANGVRFHAKGGVEAYIEEGGENGKVTNCTRGTETE